jgi:hypothetical protein
MARHTDHGGLASANAGAMFWRYAMYGEGPDPQDVAVTLHAGAAAMRASQAQTVAAASTTPSATAPPTGAVPPSATAPPTGAAPPSATAPPTGGSSPTGGGTPGGPVNAGFVVHPNGEAVAIPVGATARVADNGRGVVYEGGAGGSRNNAYHSRVTGVRVMQPTQLHPNGYVVYQASTGQAVSPTTGQVGLPNSHPERHIDFH